MMAFDSFKASMVSLKGANNDMTDALDYMQRAAEDENFYLSDKDEYAAKQYIEALHDNLKYFERLVESRRISLVLN